MLQNKPQKSLIEKPAQLPSWPYFAEDEIEAAMRVLRSGKVNYWTGNECKLFEKEFAKYIGCKHAIALANGTVALELALYALDIGVGDEVVVPSRTFIATASCVVARGAKPIVADVDPISQNITAETIAAVLTPKTKAIIVVHLAGWPCDMDSILELARKYNLKVIEDCAQAHGAKYKGQQVGSFGDVAAFSFCQDKIMTTAGEGGMLVTNKTELWQKSWAYKDHGKDYDRVHDREHLPGFRWLHANFGTNWRMTEVQAAIGRIQLSKLSDWVSKRRQYAEVLSSYFENVDGFRITRPTSDYYHAYYKYYVFVKPSKLKNSWNRDLVMQTINENGVPCFVGSCSEIYLEDAFIRNGLHPTRRFSVAQMLGETSLMFLVHPTYEEQDMHNIGSLTKKVMNSAV